MGNAASSMEEISMITFEPRDEYLYVHIAGGASDYTVMQQHWVNIASKRRECNCTRVLVETHMNAMPDAADVFAMVTGLRDIGLSRCRLAVADENPENHELNVFANVVAANRNICFRTFSSVSDAERWLTEH